jgi:TolB-like protein
MLFCYSHGASRVASVLLLVLAASCCLFSADAMKKIPAGSKIFVDADKGFDIYLDAALQKKNVPVKVMEDKDKADYILTGSSLHEDKNWASKIFLGHRDTSEATVKLVDAKSGELVWAYAVHKKNSVHGNQSTAEACAKHLKDAIEK